jgi:hypothetical protein
VAKDKLCIICALSALFASNVSLPICFIICDDTTVNVNYWEVVKSPHNAVSKDSNIF